MSLSQLKTVVPGIDWIKYLKTISTRKIEPEEEVIVFAIKYFENLVDLINTTPRKVIANYLMWRFMKNRVEYLGKEFQV